jgi:hypothetical protein
MADFSTAQAALAAARKGLEAAQLAAAQAAARQQALAAAQKRLARTLNRDPTAVAETARLDALGREAAADANAKRGEAARAATVAGGALRDFAAFSDPRRNVSSLSDESPFVLFPLRLETRFAAVGSGDGTKHQLWVRIYPDDCSIDTFEEMLSAMELANAQRYWQGIFRAGGIEADQRAAWRSLVAAHGSGRAGYIVDTYQPTNLPAPSKAAASDEILVIATQTALASAEANAIATYWQAVWLADGDLTRQQSARAALDATVGAARATELVAAYRPYNLADRPQPPLDRAHVALSTAFVIFPPDPPTRQGAWSQAPQVKQFPERFVVLGYNGGQKTLEAIGGVVEVPLYVGPDPSADPETDPTSAIHPDGGDLFVPDQLKWMVDFERAVAVGTGIAVDLTPAQEASGFDRLIVLGLQLSARHVDGQAGLEELLRHHAVGRSGLAIVPQGTPTHNTTGNGAGYTRVDDPDQRFDDRKNAPLFTVNADPMQKRDGEWVAELLGVDPALFTGIHSSDGKDQMRARAMQRALWPATVGYWMDKLLAPVFNDDTIASTRWFFTQSVSGRGSVPTIRIGCQPYGILPTTAFSRIRWLDPERQGEPGWNDAQLNFLRGLLAVLRALDTDWTAMSTGNAHVGRSGDAHQTLLDVVGLHPSSVEYYSRSAESLSELFNIANLWGVGPDFIRTLNALSLHAAAAGLLARLGYTGSAQPDILQHFFLRDAGQITNIIDDRPLSETDPIRSYTDDGRNYIRWLIDAANTSLEALRTEQGFSQNVTPTMLLYLYLRHALMLGYYDTSYGLHKSAGFLSDADLAAMKPEPAFVHVADAATASESRFSALYKTEPRITGNPTLLVSDYISRNLGSLPQSRGLKDQLDALAILVDAPTADLERAFAEHIDICSYRFDAWLLGLVNLQLQAMRYGRGRDGKGPTTGVYLGAYAWVEDLRPSSSQPVQVQLPPDIARNFPGSSPIVHDPGNGGYIHAPSLTQARTAAVLRSGYLANATPDNPQTMAVNLSSDRVRLALSLLEGVRSGQSLGAILGYQFERGLHDDHGLAEVDKFIYPLRKAFPLVADSLSTTKTPPDVPIEAIEARNVLDGRKLLSQMSTSGVTTYPFGLTSLPAATTAEAAAINAEASALRDLYDALSDLALTEGVHQAVQGNFERIAATLDAYSTGNFPPDPQVVETPPAGIGLTHRVAVHLRAGLAASPGATPRAQAEPALDDWLASLLPPLDQIGCTVTWSDHNGVAQQQAVTLDQLALRPIDLLSLIKPDGVQTMTQLDDRVLRFAIATAAPRPDAQLKIAYMTPPPATFSIFEVTALVRSLKALVTGARALRATDATLSNDARPDQNATVFVDRARIAMPAGALATLATDIGAFLTNLQALVANPVANRAAIVGGIDDFLDAAVALLERAARFAMPLSGWGFAYAWRHRAVADLLAQVQDLVMRWGVKLHDFDAKILAYDALPAGTSDDERFTALRAAEVGISTQPEPAPANPGALRSLLDIKKNEFAARRNLFAGVLTSSGSRFSDFLDAAAALLPVTAFDPQPFDLTAFGDRAVVLAQDLVTTLTGHRTAVETRRDAVQTQLDAHDAAALATDQVQALQLAAQALFGDEFFIVPEFGLAVAQADEWANAVAASPTLLSYLTTTAAIDFPVDEWLAGVARVRPMLHAFESVVMLSSAFGQTEPTLVPAQFPFAPNAPWLAMQFPADYTLDGDRLLYTAQYLTPFDKTARQCGLLLDEWTEVIPATTRTTGITFNFNRPDNEAPQSILLVTPASASGAWQWDDLVGALNETLDLAKKRSVEPTQLDSTPYAPLLPTTVMAATLYGISITTSLTAADDAFRNLEAARNV